MSMNDFMLWMENRGLPRSKAEWTRRARDGQFGTKVGAQWVVSESDAHRMLERLLPSAAEPQVETDDDLMSLTEFTAWMAERGVVRSRAEWYRRVQAGQIGRKIGSQWVVSESEARRLLLALKS